ncbi:hypothetical protein ACLMJK_001917 [Lecanora helva]
MTFAFCIAIYGISRISWDQTALPKCQNKVNLKFESGSTVQRKSNVTIFDNYLGARPHLNTVANLQLMLERCQDAVDGLGVDDVIKCLSFLQRGSDEYFISPAAQHGGRDSEARSQKVSSAENAFQERRSPQNLELVSRSSFDVCPGPKFLYHAYWRGPASWRLELFVKAYLYTQNLACSRLWIWVESDIDSNAVDRMLCENVIFRRFMPLIQSGDIVVKAWHLPNRILLPSEANESPVSDAVLGEHNLSDHYVMHVPQDHLHNWLRLGYASGRFAPVQVSDAVRFIVLHAYGGIYLDMDVMLLRDMRPLLLQPQPFAEQWVERGLISDYNTAVLSITANSSLSTYFLKGAVGMGMNFHPKAIGKMLEHDGRTEQLAKLHNAFFDPLVTNLRRKGTDNCTVPCHKNFQQVFKTQVEEPEKEWSAYYGINSERTMNKFFRGAFAYHIHNQWQKVPEPKSWMDVITTAHDGYFEGSRSNAYGEQWQGPRIEPYDRKDWPGF